MTDRLRPRPDQLPAPQGSRQQRRLGGADPAALSLALSGMTFYWLTPMIAERRRLRPKATDPRRVFAFEWLLRLLHGLSCWLAGRSLTLDTVAFPYPPPPHAAEYARVYTECSTFGAPCQRTIDDGISLPIE